MTALELAEKHDNLVRWHEEVGGDEDVMREARLIAAALRLADATHSYHVALRHAAKWNARVNNPFPKEYELLRASDLNGVADRFRAAVDREVAQFRAAAEAEKEESRGDSV